ncbi:MAG TPA: hypothetical protein VHW00_11420 [Thermoanaerobaculia bacterium]|nr:hypothetical protein [Thermoanaerobaculia bacterium]
MRKQVMFFLGLSCLLAANVFAAPAVQRSLPDDARLESSILYPIDARLADGAAHQLSVQLVLNGRELHRETYGFAVIGRGMHALPLLLQGATRDVLASMDREQAKTMRVAFTIDSFPPKEMTVAELLRRDAVTRTRLPHVIREYTIDGALHDAPAPAPRTSLVPTTNTEEYCPNSSNCMAEYWDCKGCHCDNEYNEYCDGELQVCLFGSHVTRNVRTNDQYSFANAPQVCAFDNWWEAFSPSIYLMGGHTYTDQVWDDWYCGGTLISSTLVSSTNGSETCWRQTTQSCSVGSATNIGGECTNP